MNKMNVGIGPLELSYQLQILKLEVVLPFFLRNLEFNYLEKIGVCGYIGNANGKEFISE